MDGWGMPLRGRKQLAYLPQNQASTFGSQHQNIAILPPRDGNAADALRERNGRLLVAFLPAIHMHDGFFGLRGEDMRRTHGQAIGGRRALLEGGAQVQRRLEFMHADTHISEARRRWRFAGRQRRRDETLGEHEEMQRKEIAGGREIPTRCQFFYFF